MGKNKNKNKPTSSSAVINQKPEEHVQEKPADIPIDIGDKKLRKQQERMRQEEEKNRTVISAAIKEEQKMAKNSQKKKQNKKPADKSGNSKEKKQQTVTLKRDYEYVENVSEKSTSDRKTEHKEQPYKTEVDQQQNKGEYKKRNLPSEEFEKRKTIASKQSMHGYTYDSENWDIEQDKKHDDERMKNSRRRDRPTGWGPEKQTDNPTSWNVEEQADFNPAQNKYESRKSNWRGNDKSSDNYRDYKGNSSRSERNYGNMRHGADDPHFSMFFYKAKRSEIINYNKVEEIKGDLFSAPETYSLGHCVAEDMSMGAGIAKTFRSKFNHVPELLNQWQQTGGLAVLPEGNRFIYYLVTKELSRGKPTYYTLWQSMQKLKEHILRNGVQNLAIPQIGCGLDQLEWTIVKQMLEYVFQDVEIDIKVYILDENLFMKAQQVSRKLTSDYVKRNKRKHRHRKSSDNYHNTKKNERNRFCSAKKKRKH